MLVPLQRFLNTTMTMTVLNQQQIAEILADLQENSFLLSLSDVLERLTWATVGNIAFVVSKTDPVTPEPGTHCIIDGIRIEGRPKPVDLCIIGEISIADYYLTSDAGWKPSNKIGKGFHKANASCMIGCSSVAPFDMHWPLYVDALSALQTSGQDSSLPVKNLVTNDKTLKLRHILFLV